MNLSAKTIWSIILKTIVFTIVVGYVSHTNMLVLNNRRIAGIPDGHVRVMIPEHNHLALLMPRHGGIYFNYYGTSINVYFAHYIQDERILHEHITGLDVGEDWMLSGELLWGITKESTTPSEILVSMAIGGDRIGTIHQHYFDLSSIDFETRLHTGALIDDGAIERGKQNILALWSAGGRLWVDGNMLEPYRLRQNTETAVLYVVFD